VCDHLLSTWPARTCRARLRLRRLRGAAAPLEDCRGCFSDRGAVAARHR
jgi:hypothetical protein